MNRKSVSIAAGVLVLIAIVIAGLVQDVRQEAAIERGESSPWIRQVDFGNWLVRNAPRKPGDPTSNSPLMIGVVTALVVTGALGGGTLLLVRRRP